MADEKLVLVERFEELRTGMRIVFKECAWCGGDDACVITNPSICFPDGWRVEPSCTGSIQVVRRCAIDDRQVWRYAADLDMERELAAETARDRPYVGPVVAAAMRMGLLPQ